MDVKEKLCKLSFVKNQMMKEGPENINDVEPTICQIFEDVLGIGSLSPKCISPVSHSLSPWVNQFPHTHSAETETHIHFNYGPAKIWGIGRIPRRTCEGKPFQGGLCVVLYGNT